MNESIRTLLSWAALLLHPMYYTRSSAVGSCSLWAVAQIVLTHVLT